MCPSSLSNSHFLKQTSPRTRHALSSIAPSTRARNRSPTLRPGDACHMARNLTTYLEKCTYLLVVFDHVALLHGPPTSCALEPRRSGENGGHSGDLDDQPSRVLPLGKSNHVTWCAQKPGDPAAPLWLCTFIPSNM